MTEKEFLSFIKKVYECERKTIEVPFEIRFTGFVFHLPKEGNTYKRCRLCSTVQHDKHSKIFCLGCKVPPTTTPGFKKFHKV